MKTGFGINRNILECKYKMQSKKTAILVVLIETYWNVNEKHCKFE